jgi:molecular chaperone Hsp33
MTDQNTTPEPTDGAVSPATASAAQPARSRAPRALAITVEDHELVDPGLSSERLLYRLFHERGVTVFDSAPLRHACRCSRESIERMLRRFTPQERRDMVGDDGRIGVACEFCGVKREFEPADIEEG